jgi:hypothetical protein
MYSRAFFALLLLAALAVSLSRSVAAPSPQNSDPATYTLRGTVVNSVTGEGVAGALVRIFLNGQRAVRADAAGTFEISAVRAGNAAIHVSKPGYFGTDNIPREVPPLTVLIGPDTGPQVLKLVPEGILYGRISGDDGEPVSGIQIQILQLRVMNGRKRRVAAGGMVTDDEGRFRASELHPGRYFLMAGPENLSELANGADSSTATQYGAMFYPGVSEFSEATAIEIAPGQRAETDFKLVRQPLYQVSGVVSGGPPGCEVQLAVLNDIGHGIGRYFVSRDTGAFNAGKVPSGASQFTAICQDKNDRTYSGATAVKLASDVANLRVTLLSSVDIPIRIRKEGTRGGLEGGTAQQLSRLNPSFFATDNGSVTVSLLPLQDTVSVQMEYYSEAASQDDDGLRVVKSVPPGTYDVQAFAHGRYYVESARAGTVDLLKESLSVSGGAEPPVEIVLREDGASLAVSPQQNGALAPAAVVIWSEDAPKLVRERNTIQSVPIRLNNLMPGTYRVLALPAGSDPEYRNPDFLRKYATQWQEITLATNQNATLTIELAKDLE